MLSDITICVMYCGCYCTVIHLIGLAIGLSIVKDAAWRCQLNMVADLVSKLHTAPGCRYEEGQGKWAPNGNGVIATKNRCDSRIRCYEGYGLTSLN